jgi:GNAT superfamily N-acetyltransferase
MAAVEYVLLGWPADEPTLALDHREFAYAGKFRVAATGKAVVRDAGRADPDGEYDDRVLAAVAFEPGRVDDSILWLRYVDVRADHRGEGLGARLCRFVRERTRERYPEARIAVNNPFSYHAVHKAGFGWTGETGGLAELLCSTDAPRTRERYQAGLDEFRAREPSESERSFLEERRGCAPPEPVECP